jgi:hypothetical protein
MIMKIRLIVLIGILTFIIIYSCNKENESNGLISISGITELDSIARNIGMTDTTDWRFTDTWTSTEEELFKQNNPEHLFATEKVRPNSSVVVIGYPNPVRSSSKEDMIAFCFQLESNMYYDMRIVDEDLNIKVQFDSVKYNYLHVKDSAFLSNELYRLYYKVYSDNKVYRGHGDFKFIK